MKNPSYNGSRELCHRGTQMTTERTEIEIKSVAQLEELHLIDRRDHDSGPVARTVLAMKIAYIPSEKPNTASNIGCEICGHIMGMKGFKKLLPRLKNYQGDISGFSGEMLEAAVTAGFRVVYLKWNKTIDIYAELKPEYQIYVDKKRGIKRGRNKW